MRALYSRISQYDKLIYSTQYRESIGYYDAVVATRQSEKQIIDAVGGITADFVTNSTTEFVKIVYEPICRLIKLVHGQTLFIAPLLVYLNEKTGEKYIYLRNIQGVVGSAPRQYTDFYGIEHLEYLVSDDIYGLKYCEPTPNIYALYEKLVAKRTDKLSQIYLEQLHTLCAGNKSTQRTPSFYRLEHHGNELLYKDAVNNVIASFDLCHFYKVDFSCNFGAIVDMHFDSYNQFEAQDAQGCVALRNVAVKIPSAW